LLTPFRTVIIFLVLSLIGIAFVSRLPLAFTPDYTLPGLQLTYSLPNASPELVEQQATAPLENALSQISGIQQIKSTSSYHHGNISLSFQPGSDLDFKKFEVSALIRQLYPKLAEGLSYPQLEPQRQEQDEKSPLLIYNIIAPETTHQIRDLSHQVLSKSLLQLEGIEEVQLNGFEPLQISIRYHEELLLRYGFSTAQIAAQIGNQFRELHAGLYQNGHQALHMKVENSLTDIRQLEEMLLTYRKGMPIRLKQLADIKLEEQQARSHYRINGHNTISLSVQARKGVNRLALASEVKELLAVAEQQLPSTYQLLLNYDDTRFLRQELHKIYWRAGLSVLILLLFIFLLKRNLRYLLVLFCGVAVNLSLMALLIYWLGISVHLYTLAGLTISFGLIMDNAIVMLDHLQRKGNRKIFLALLAASLTTIAALSIVLFLPEKEQQNLLEFAQVISLNLAVSLLVALFFTPAIQQLLLPQKEAFRKIGYKNLRLRTHFMLAYQRIISLLAAYRKTLIAALVLLFGLPVFMLPPSWEGQDWYNASIGSELYQDEIRPYVDIALGGTLRMFVRDVFENSGYRSPEETKLFVTAELPYGNTLEQMDYIIRKLEVYLEEVEGIDRFITQIYSGQYAHLSISFKPGYGEGIFPYQLKSKLTARGLDWGGVGWSIWGVGKAFSNSSGGDMASFRVMLKGYNYEELDRQAQVLAARLLTHKRIHEVNTNEQMGWREKSSSEWVLELAQEPLSLRGFSGIQAAAALRSQSRPTGPNLYASLQDKLIPVQIYRQGTENFDRYDLMHKPIAISDSLLIHFGEFASLKLKKTANTIYKEDRQYLRVVGFDYFGSAHFGDKFLEEKLEEMKTEMPVGYSAEKNNWSWDNEAIQRQYGLLAVLIVAIFFICSILFENLRQPLMIIAIIPLSFIGLFITFAGFGFYFDQGGYAAFILLGGIVVNAAIFIVNDLNNLPSRNYNRAIIKAVAQKTQPILLTILSTCLGLIPFLLEGDSEIFWFSMAAGTIGGLVFSVFAIFLFLPVWLLRKVSK
jgi:multidrug efflux pump subunit AcrB